jgi:hypothetical protein
VVGTTSKFQVGAVTKSIFEVLRLANGKSVHFVNSILHPIQLTHLMDEREAAAIAAAIKTAECPEGVVSSNFELKTSALCIFVVVARAPEVFERAARQAFQMLKSRQLVFRYGSRVSAGQR